MPDALDVRVFLAKATESLETAESEFANRRYGSCANRCYYACFQVAVAALMRAARWRAVMGTLTVDEADPRIQTAIAELQALIRERHSEATFSVAVGEDPEGIYLTVVVDLDDPDEVLDLVVDRLLEMEIDEELPVYVVPTRTPERVEAMLAGQRHRGPLSELTRIVHT